MSIDVSLKPGDPAEATATQGALEGQLQHVAGGLGGVVVRAVLARWRRFAIRVPRVTWRTLWRRLRRSNLFLRSVVTFRDTVCDAACSSGAAAGTPACVSTTVAA